MCASAYTKLSIIGNCVLAHIKKMIICYNGFINIQICLIFVIYEPTSEGNV
jgi:hypothetical protein